MKTITYSVSNDDVNFLVDTASKAYCKDVKAYEANPHRWGKQDKSGVLAMFKYQAQIFATFALFERDGIAAITKETDEFYAFADHKGDTFCPVTNPDIDSDELKRQERRERARFNRQGVHFHTLVVDGFDCDSIGGFVGNDFYGSGYDYDFYNDAIKKISSTHADYIEAINNVWSWSAIEK